VQVLTEAHTFRTLPADTGDARGPLGRRQRQASGPVTPPGHRIVDLHSGFQRHQPTQPTSRKPRGQSRSHGSSDGLCSPVSCPRSQSAPRPRLRSSTVESCRVWVYVSEHPHGAPTCSPDRAGSTGPGAEPRRPGRRSFANRPGVACGSDRPPPCMVGVMEPVVLDRRFRPWRYGVGHGQLLLHSPAEQTMASTSTSCSKASSRSSCARPTGR
jgi:hypothetical protein